MKNLLNLSTNLINCFNSNATNILNDFNTNKDLYKNLLYKIEELKLRIDIEKCKARADLIICKLCTENKNVIKVIKVYENDELIGVVGDNVTKPNVEYERESKCCDKAENNTTPIDNGVDEYLHRIDEPDFVNEYEIVYDEKRMTQLFDTIQSDCILKLYKHDYRAYKGFTCFVLVITKGKSFIIDTLKIRRIRHSVYKNKTLKYFYCNKCVAYFENEFCEISNKKSLDLESKTFCDWRMRPFPKVYDEIITKDIKDLIKSYSKQTNKDLVKIKDLYEDKLCGGVKYEEMNEKNVFYEDFDEFTEYFLNKYNLSITKKDLVNKIIQLRNFLAKTNDESIYYVLTDMQMLKIIFDMPKTREEFIKTLGRMSPVVREHITDFIMIIQSCKDE